MAQDILKTQRVRGRQGRPNAQPSPEHRKRWYRRRRLWLIILLLLAAGATVYYTRLRYTVIVPRNDASVPAALSDSKISIERLSKEGDSRLNILLLGQGGEGHSGATLTDTMQVMSLDLTSQQVALLSIPRDLYVKTQYGSMKINAVYQTANSRQKQSGGAEVKKVAGDITDLNLHYFLAIDFDGFKQLIDMLGGVDIDVKNPINDYEYPNKDENGYTTFRLKPGLQHLDGDTALKFARSRHSGGVEGSDFARSARQQQVISAIKEKAADSGYFKNPFKMVQLVNVLSQYLRTDMTPAEIRLLAERISAVDVNEFKTAVLSNSEAGLLIDGRIKGAGYTLVPRAGNYTYTEIGRLMHRLAPDPLLKEEAARIRLRYPAKKEKEATQTLSLLADYGYNVVASEALSSGEKADQETVIIDYRRKKPYTVNYLQHRFGAKIETARAVQDDIDLDLILGE